MEFLCSKVLLIAAASLSIALIAASSALAALAVRTVSVWRALDESRVKNMACAIARVVPA